MGSKLKRFIAFACLVNCDSWRLKERKKGRQTERPSKASSSSLYICICNVEASFEISFLSSLLSFFFAVSCDCRRGSLAMAALSMTCGVCNAQLRSVQEAREHAEMSGHTDFAESTEPVRCWRGFPARFPNLFNLWCRSHVMSCHVMSSHLISSHLMSSHVISSHRVWFQVLNLVCRICGKPCRTKTVSTPASSSSSAVSKNVYNSFSSLFSRHLWW